MLNTTKDYCDAVKKKANSLVDISVQKVRTIMNTMGIMMAGMSAFLSIKKMFKGKDEDHLVVALGMDLDGNPTSQMGHMLFELASSDAFQNTKSLDEFLQKIQNKSYPKEFMKLYDE